MTQFSLTQRQKDTLDFIRDYMVEHPEVAPSFEEIMHGCGMKSKSHVGRIVRELKERGRVDYIPGRRRSIFLIDPLT